MRYTVRDNYSGKTWEVDDNSSGDDSPGYFKIIAIVIGILVLFVFLINWVPDFLAEHGILKTTFTVYLSSDDPDINYKNYSVMLGKNDDNQKYEVTKIEISDDGTGETKLRRGQYDFSLVDSERVQFHSSPFINADGLGSLTMTPEMNWVWYRCVHITFVDQDGEPYLSENIDCNVIGAEQTSFALFGDGTGLLLIEEPATNIETFFTDNDVSSVNVTIDFSGNTFYYLTVQMRSQP